MTCPWESEPGGWRVTEERWLEGDELARELDAVTHPEQRYERVRVRETEGAGGAVGREWGFR